VNPFFILAASVALFYIIRKITGNVKVSTRVKIRLNPVLVEKIETISDTVGAPANVVGAIVVTESGGDILATGKAGERGLMQLTEIALEDVNQHRGTNFKMNQMFSADQNIAAGSMFLALQISRFDGFLDDAIRAYNGGERGARAGCCSGYLAKVKVWI